MVITVVVLALLVLDPMTATTTARNAVWALLFVSNVQFALADGYFNPSSETNWLLHTWTLGVEWQFYLLYPWLMLLLGRSTAAWRLRLPLSLIACALLLVATLIVVAQSNVTLQLGFFMLPTRAWELLAGGCVAFAPRAILEGRGALAAQAGGLALIVASCLVIDPSTPWPSLWTVLPVAGTVIVLIADCNQSRWIGAAPVQTLGTWSYSIYLWHWPVIVGLRLATGAAAVGGSSGVGVMAAGLVATLAISGLSYRFVEVGLRDRLFPRSGSRLARNWSPWALWVAAVAVCVVGWRTDGLEAMRVRSLNPAARARLADYEAATRDWVGAAPCPGGGERLSVGHVCRLGAPDRHDVAVYGDSHVEQRSHVTLRLAASRPTRASRSSIATAVRRSPTGRPPSRA